MPQGNPDETKLIGGGKEVITISRTMQDRIEKKAFRMRIILPLLHMEPADRTAMIKALTSKEMEIPGSKKTTLSSSTIYGWLTEFRTSDSRDVEAVLLGKERSDKGESRSLTQVQKDHLMVWRAENPRRSVRLLREDLLCHDLTKEGVPSETTIARVLRDNGYDRKSCLQRENAKRNPNARSKVRLSFEASYPQQIWQADTKGGGVRVIDPIDPTKLVLASPIVIIDDNSRFMVAIRFVIKENENAVIQLLRGSIALYGVPETFYTDLGGPYHGKRLEQGALVLGCIVKHTAARSPESKGKIERVLQDVENHLESEIEVLGRNVTLEELNLRAEAYRHVEYNARKHSALDTTPAVRFARLPADKRRFISENALAMVFLECRLKASVSNHGLIIFRKNQYLVPSGKLYNKKVTIRYQEDSVEKISVWYDDHYFGEACLYVPDNDFEKRMNLQKQLGELTQPTPLPPTDSIIPYGKFERDLLTYQQNLEQLGITEEIKNCRDARGEIKRELMEKSSPPSLPSFDPFTMDSCIKLFAELLERYLTPSERTIILAVWRNHGPFTEGYVRKTLGVLLGNSHPKGDLQGFLDALIHDTTCSNKE